MEKLGTIRWVYMTKLLFIVECVFESERERERESIARVFRLQRVVFVLRWRELLRCF